MASRDPGSEGQCPWPQIHKLRPGGAWPGLSARQKWVEAPNGPPPADLPPPRPSGGSRWEQAVSQPPSPGRPPPGRSGQQAQVSRTAGSPASSHPRLCGARGRVSPQGRQRGRQAGGVAVWPRSGVGLGGPGQALMPSSKSPRRLGRPGVSTGTSLTAPSHDPCAALPPGVWSSLAATLQPQPAPVGSAGPIWGPPAQASGCQLQTARWSLEAFPGEGPVLPSRLVLLEGSHGHDLVLWN